jgi:hypothetical protein
MRETIIVAGSLAQRPQIGGHTWVFLQYLLGFRRLGWDVLFVDRLEPEMCIGADGAPTELQSSLNLGYLTEVMERSVSAGRCSTTAAGRWSAAAGPRWSTRRDAQRC